MIMCFEYNIKIKLNDKIHNCTLFILQAPKFTLEMIMEQATALQELLPIRMRWEPVEKILALNGIPLMLF